MGERIKDYRHYQRQAELKSQRAAQDVARNALHKQFDLQAQDNTMKYERPSFAVVTASDSFREGWDRIFGERNRPLVEPPVDPGQSVEDEEDE